MAFNIQGTGLVGSGGSGGGGGGSTPPADIASGVDQSLDIESIKTASTNIANTLGSTSDTANSSSGTVGSIVAFIKGIVGLLYTRLPAELGPQSSVSSLSVTPGVGSTFNTDGLTDAQLRATPIPVRRESTSSWTVIGSTSAVNTTTIPAGSRLQSFLIQNLTANTIHVQIHTTAPSVGAVPTSSYRVFGNSALLLGNDFYGDGGSVIPTANPVIAISSTHGTYTAQASPNTSLTVRYIL